MPGFDPTDLNYGPYGNQQMLSTLGQIYGVPGMQGQPYGQAYGLPGSFGTPPPQTPPTAMPQAPQQPIQPQQPPQPPPDGSQPSAPLSQAQPGQANAFGAPSGMFGLGLQQTPPKKAG